MKIQPLLVTLTMVNVALLTVSLTRPWPTQAQDAVLRGRGLEIVDAGGRVRASIILHPADPTFRMPDGAVGYPETVVLRLIDPNGRPTVKIEASERGAGLALIGQADATHVAIGAKQTTSMRLTNREPGEAIAP